MEKQLAFRGILSNKAEENPDFFNWNRVNVRYCDGASFTGDDEDKAKNVGTVVVGPWGGLSGKPWSYKFVGDICNIYISHNDEGINSISFDRKDADGKIHVSDVFGYPHGERTNITIDTKVEKLQTIEGSVGKIRCVKRVTSLVFQTDKGARYGVGPGNKDCEFAISIGKDPLSGFHGRCGDALISIGISYDVLKTRDVAGPSPNDAAGEAPWNYISKGPICQISVSCSADILHSLQFASRDAYGNLHMSEVIGKPEGAKIREINIDTKVEKITGISGTYGPYDSGRLRLVKSLTFITNNMKLIGPFGAERSKDFDFAYEVEGENVISGFHGCAGLHIDSIGFTIQSSKTSAANIGRFFGDEGNGWSYEPEGIITRVFLTYDGVVRTLQFESIDENGETELSQVFGSQPDSNKYTINIDKDNKITNISGTFADYPGSFITGMYISTEMYVYGPFGKDGKGTRFSFPVKDGCISGFHGQSTSGLRDIGIYVKPTKWVTEVEEEEE